MNFRFGVPLFVIVLTLCLVAGCASAPVATSAPTAAPAATVAEATTEPTAVVLSTDEVTATTAMTTTIESTESVGLANPASQNCTEQGGTLTMATRGDGGEYGICTFEDNRQCEEWALLRGQCPVGGLKITGYLTPAAQYCAITGGTYTDNGTTSADNEMGVCTFPSGTSCPAADYYNGKCSDAGTEGGSVITSTTAPTATSSVGMANPASQNCTAQGGMLTIEERGDGGQFGVCTFEDNQQCEEWALLRGQCPVGGIKVTGYLTPAARYCAITGGEYTDNGTTSADDEMGVCTFTGGASCPAADYYNGKCSQ